MALRRSNAFAGIWPALAPANAPAATLAVAGALPAFAAYERGVRWNRDGSDDGGMPRKIMRAPSCWVYALAYTTCGMARICSCALAYSSATITRRRYASCAGRRVGRRMRDISMVCGAEDRCGMHAERAQHVTGRGFGAIRVLTKRVALCSACVSASVAFSCRCLRQLAQAGAAERGRRRA